MLRDGQILGVWACARPIVGSGVEIQRSFSVCYDAGMMGYCQNCFKRYLSDPDEHVYTVFKLRNLVRKKCPVSGNGLALSTLVKRWSSAEVVARLAVAPNII